MVDTKIQKLNMHQYTYYMYSDNKKETINVETDCIRHHVTHIKSNKNRDIRKPSTKQH